jgi:hypothetical protein
MGMGADEDPEVGDVIAFWLEGATEEKRDAHHRAERWAHVLSWQIERLYASRREAMESQKQVRASGFYPDEARWPFFEMEADAHFALVAARQLLRALRAFDGNDRLPDGLTNSQLRDVRDALEHWDVPGGSEAAKRLKKHGASASSHRWSPAGPGVLGDLVSDAVLARWGADVYSELLRWDPYDGWRENSS